jgi:large subunit ribosomal protein L19
MNQLEAIEKEQMRMDIPRFGPGDTVKVHVKIKEGEKERIQVFEGTVIKKTKGFTRSSFTVRKISYGVGVERIFPLHSPVIEKIDVIQKGSVRRARLFYLRKRKGKAARVKELKNF